MLGYSGVAIVSRVCSKTDDPDAKVPKDPAATSTERKKQNLLILCLVRSWKLETLSRRRHLGLAWVLW